MMIDDDEDDDDDDDDDKFEFQKKTWGVSD